MRKLISIAIVLVICVLLCGPAWTQDKPKPEKGKVAKKAEPKTVEVSYLRFRTKKDFKNGQEFIVDIMFGPLWMNEGIPIKFFRSDEAAKEAITKGEYAVSIGENDESVVFSKILIPIWKGKRHTLHLVDAKDEIIFSASYRTRKVVKTPVKKPAPQVQTAP